MLMGRMSFLKICFEAMEKKMETSEKILNSLKRLTRGPGR